MSQPQYAVILTEENFDEIFADPAASDLNVRSIKMQFERNTHRGERTIAFMLTDSFGHMSAFNMIKYIDALHDQIKLSETVAHGHWKLIEE